MESNISHPKSICVLRFSAIGDVCHAVAAIQAIQQRWPDTHLTWVIGQVEHQLVRGLKDVEFIVFDKSKGWRAYLDLKKQLRNRHFDLLLHMQVSMRANLASLFISANEKWGFDRARAREGQWLFTNRKIAPQFQPHVAEGFMAFAYAIGVELDTQLQWQMPIDPSEAVWFERRFNQHNKYIVISAAASEKERNWLPERYAALADYAASNGYEVVLCGAGNAFETELAQKIIDHCCRKPINLVGKTNLRQLLLVLKNARLLIAPDTGPVHMAVSVNTPVIGLYMHSNPKRTGPYQSQQFVVSHYQQTLFSSTGKDDRQHPWGKRLKGDSLMTLIAVDEVKLMFDRVIEFVEQGKITVKPSATVKSLPIDRAS